MIGVERITGLALLTTLVGMACPGLHSIFTAFQVEILDGVPDRPGIGFYVRVADPRFRVALRMMIGGLGLREAPVSAFVRMPPMAMPAMADLVDLVAADEFAGQRVLIVGGSRGLGALSARLVAAGGGDVVLTYARGMADADAVASDIRSLRGEAACAVFPMDVTQALSAFRPEALSGRFTGLLQPSRHRPPDGKSRLVFVPAVHEEFFQYYVRAFADLVALLLASDAEAKLNVFYPSSVAVTEPPEDMTEYAMAKAAGEVLRDQPRGGQSAIAHGDRSFAACCSTDQNAQPLLQAEFADLVGTMLPLAAQDVTGVTGDARALVSGLARTAVSAERTEADAVGRRGRVDQG